MKFPGIVLAVVLGTSWRVEAKPVLAVTPLESTTISEAHASILADVLVATLAAQKKYDILGPSDINAMLGLERMKDALGCSDLSCAAEIGGALGAAFLVGGTANVLGDELIVQLALIDTKASKVVSRGRSIVPNDERQYRRAAETAAHALLGKSQGQSAPSISSTPPTDSGTSFLFHTAEAEHEINVTFTGADGKARQCAQPLKVGVPCKLPGLPVGKALLAFRSGALVPFQDDVTVKPNAGIQTIDVRTTASVGSIMSWVWGGIAIFTGVALTGVGYGTDTNGLVVAGVPTTLVGGGLLALGFWFEPRIDVNYPGIDAFF